VGDYGDTRADGADDCGSDVMEELRECPAGFDCGIAGLVFETVFGDHRTRCYVMCETCGYDRYEEDVLNGNVAHCEKEAAENWN